MGNFWAAAAQTTQFQHNRAHLGPIYPITNLPIYPICSAGYNQLRPLSGNNSVVECDLAKVEVAGSNPVSRSRILLRSRSISLRSRRGTQVVRERSAKPLCGSSILPRASNPCNSLPSTAHALGVPLTSLEIYGILRDFLS